MRIIHHIHNGTKDKSPNTAPKTATTNEEIVVGPNRSLLSERSTELPVIFSLWVGAVVTGAAILMPIQSTSNIHSLE
jgi:hypothetical protein